ncbi:hypothetical protein ULF88_04760 [Halopseudomonas pachastrellae]|nr:hypothetical protein [Halopseudomonas pachastrellae]
MAQALSSLGDEQPLSVRRQLWRQSVAFLERYPQGVRVSWGQEDFGGLKTLGRSLALRVLSARTGTCAPMAAA